MGAASLQTGGCTTCVPGDGDFAVTSSEWWRLYFEELGGTAHVPIGTSNSGGYSLFQSIEGDAFWGRDQSGNSAALFRDGGEQTRDLTSNVAYRAWAVRDGQSITNPPVAPAITFLPESPTFSITPYNTTASGAVTLKNIGTAAATISSITANNDFSMTHNCGTSLAINATCVVTVFFKPTDLLVRTGVLTVNADTVFSTPLAGVGGISASISASSASVKEGKSVTLTWNSSPHSVCTGVGGTADWAGPLTQSGSRDVSSKESGMFDYVISCTHDAGTLPTVAVGTQVFFGNVSSGSIDWSLLLALAFALWLAIRSRTRRASV